MKAPFKIYLSVMILALLIMSCNLLNTASPGLEATQVALAIQQTSMVMEQTRAAQAEPPAAIPEPDVQPTYTPYPTFTPQEVGEAPPDVPVEEPTVALPEPTEEPEIALSFEEWLKDIEILLYNDMHGEGRPMVIEPAIDAMGLRRNTTNVRDFMGHLLDNLNSPTDWDLVIVAAESRSSVSGEYFDQIADRLDRGSSIILEIWYLDQVFHGRVQPLMQRCGISFHRDWPRDPNANLNSFLVYLLEPEHDLFSTPNTVGMLRPYDVLWISPFWVVDAGDLLKINPGSSAVLLAGSQPREHRSYGLIAECMEGRMIWQTFATQDYRTQEMINLWQNYIYHTLRARYEYLQE